ncbi:hypothetical protein MKX01_011811 [Papaver californicum]|nr:hypothetical protein MKX01_011811 [Papaver californicum]
MSSAKPNPPLPWKTKFSLSLAGKVADLTRRKNGTINRRLFSFLDISTKIPKRPSHGLKIIDITVDPTRNLWFRLYTPTTDITNLPSTATLPVFIFFHGGGFAYFSAASKAYNDLCCRFARKLSVIVVSVNYRSSPEFKYPCQYDDAFDVLKFIEGKRCKEFPSSADLSRCFLVGDSAGGNIVHHVAVRAAKADNLREMKVIGLVLIQPFFGGEERTESEIRLKKAPLVSIARTDWLWKAFLPQGSDRNHAAVNVFGSDKSVEEMTGLENFPDTLVIIGGFDPLQDWQRRYYQGLKKCGKKVDLVEFPNAVHSFYCFPELSDCSLLINELKDFIQRNPKKITNTIEKSMK